MKEKILPFIIGLLVGAIIATGCFYLYSTTKETTIPQGEFNGVPGGMHQRGERGNFEKNSDGNTSTEDEERPELPDGIIEDGERIEMPNGEKPEGEPPVKPGKTKAIENSSEAENTENV